MISLTNPIELQQNTWIAVPVSKILIVYTITFTQIVKRQSTVWSDSLALAANKRREALAVVTLNFPTNENIEIPRIEVHVQRKLYLR